MAVDLQTIVRQSGMPVAPHAKMTNEGRRLQNTFQMDLGMDWSLARDYEGQHVGTFDPKDDIMTYLAQNPLLFPSDMVAFCETAHYHGYTKMGVSLHLILLQQENHKFRIEARDFGYKTQVVTDDNGLALYWSEVQTELQRVYGRESAYIANVVGVEAVTVTLYQAPLHKGGGGDVPLPYGLTPCGFWNPDSNGTCFKDCVVMWYLLRENERRSQKIRNVQRPAVQRKFAAEHGLNAMYYPDRPDPISLEIARFEREHQKNVVIWEAVPAHQLTELGLCTKSCPLQDVTCVRRRTSALNFPREETIVLLFVLYREDGHYVLVKNPVALFCSKRAQDKGFFACGICGLIKSAEHSAAAAERANHICGPAKETVRVKEKGEQLFFDEDKAHDKKHTTVSPCNIYADFEARNINLDHDRIHSTQRAVSFALYVTGEITFPNPLQNYYAFRAENDDTDVGHVFLQRLFHTYYRLNNIYACQGNSQPLIVNVWFHNLNYDLSHILRSFETFSLTDQTFDWDVDLIGGRLNKQKAIRFSSKREKGQKQERILLKDSIAHLTKGLDALLKECQHFTHLRAEYEERPEFVVGKTCFPYDWLVTCAQFDEPIPPRDAFTTLLAGPVSDEAWALHEARVAHYGWRTFGDLHDHYLRMDVMGLADVFTCYREAAIESLGLDPAWSYTAPGFSWKAMLKYTEQKLDYIYDKEMVVWFEGAIRGGISVAIYRETIANMPGYPNYDPFKPLTQIVYIDANNLYGKAMTHSLPYTDLQEDSTSHTVQEWMDINDAIDYKQGSGRGYFFEVDLIYPRELHEKHRDFPLAPERRTPQWDELAPEMQDIYTKEYGKKPYTPTTKLLCTLHDKSAYRIWGGELQLYVRLGLQVQRVHRVFSCVMKPWLQSYVMENTAKRQEAAAAGRTAEKDLRKLMVNSVYGKTMENVRDRLKMHFIYNSDGETLLKLTSQPLFEGAIMDVGDASFYALRKHEVLMDKPIYLGAAILAMSKVIMYSAWYEHIKPVYEDRVKLLFSDTDSLCFCVEGGTWYEDVLEKPLLRDIVDTSGYKYPNGSPYPNPNKGVLGKMKDETAPYPILEQRSFRAKMHSESVAKEPFWSDTFSLGAFQSATKGLPKRLKIGQDEWSDVAAGEASEPVSFYTLQSARVIARGGNAPTLDLGHGEEHTRQHVVEVKKKGLSLFNDKVYADGTPFGYVAH